MTLGTAVRLCLVTDSPMASGRSLAEIVAAAVRGGVTMVQLREKTASTRAFVAQAQALMTVLRPLGIPLVINDRVDVALAVDAQGVHVGQDDMPVATVRRLLGRDKIIGLSVTRFDEIGTSDLAAADYLGVGPIFAQSTKADAAPPLGLAGLQAIRQATGKPLMAIGGVDSGNAAQVLTHGADGLAVVSALMLAADPEDAARALLTASLSNPPSTS